MPMQQILVTNILATGTAFGVLGDDHTQSVFIPSRIAQQADIACGDCVNALIVPNQTHRERTPWIVVRIADAADAEPAQHPNVLASKILKDLEEGRATVLEIAESIGAAYDDVRDALTGLVSSGDVIAMTVYDLSEGDE